MIRVTKKGGVIRIYPGAITVEEIIPKQEFVDEKDRKMAIGWEEWTNITKKILEKLREDGEITCDYIYKGEDIDENESFIIKGKEFLLKIKKKT